MSTKLTVRNPSVLRLIDDGFEIEITHQHLLVHSVPYLNQSGDMKLGILACTYSELDAQDTVPQDHTMWFKGERPFRANGQEMSHVINHDQGQILFDDFKTDFYLSNKPNDQAPGNYYDKIVHYHTLFVSEVRMVAPNADGRTGVVHGQRDERSVFNYPDTASSRAGITAITQKLEQSRVAIVGVGGTGSFVLDLLAKTPVSEIHLFDFDDFELHNAFRAPGAAPLEALKKNPKKFITLLSCTGPFAKELFRIPISWMKVMCMNWTLLASYSSRLTTEVRVAH